MVAARVLAGRASDTSVDALRGRSLILLGCWRPPQLDVLGDSLGGWMLRAQHPEHVNSYLSELGDRTRWIARVTPRVGEPSAGALATLVAMDGNWVLDDQTSDEAAAAWLADLASLIHEVLESNDQ